MILTILLLLLYLKSNRMTYNFTEFICNNRFVQYLPLPHQALKI